MDFISLRVIICNDLYLYFYIFFLCEQKREKNAEIEISKYCIYCISLIIWSFCGGRVVDVVKYIISEARY